jgi:3-hydroxyacyl-[acyl-carrier-protein] dehydratase
LRKIKSEIEQFMTGLTREDGKLTSLFAFPPEFIGFQGHFPEQKILPGICQIQCVLTTLEKGTGKVVVLKEIVLAKYFSPLFPDDRATCVTGDVNDAAGEHVVKAVITKNAARISELKLRVSFEGSS